jgi:hypothetical protein
VGAGLDDSAKVIQAANELFEVGVGHLSGEEDIPDALGPGEVLVLGKADREQPCVDEPTEYDLRLLWEGLGGKLFEGNIVIARDGL